jgi:hypothetical protein
MQNHLLRFIHDQLTFYFSIIYSEFFFLLYLQNVHFAATQFSRVAPNYVPTPALQYI